MAKKGGSPPPPPDPYRVASAQTGQNINTALAQAALNQYEEVNPYGRTYYEPTGQVRTFGSAGGTDGSRRGFGDGGGFQGQAGLGGGGQYEVPTYRRVTEFSPEQQRIFEAEMALTGDLYDLGAGYTGRIAEGLNDPFTYEGLPEAPQASEEARQQVIDALYGQYTSRLDPQFEQDRRALEQRLANQGISIGSDAWGSEMDRFSRGRNDAYTTALNQAIASGGAEQSRLFGLGMDARRQGIKERAYLRDRPINEITALTSGRGLTMPQFSATPQTSIAPTDLSGNVYRSYQGELNAYNTAQQARASLISSLANLGGSAASAAIFASDERLKDDIKPTGDKVSGVPVKTWRWKDTGEKDVGVIAQDVEKKRPDAAVTFPGGVKGVNYSRLFSLGAA